MPTTSAVTQIDPRSPRFGAVITSVLLALIILLGPTSIPALVLLIIQTLAFAAGSLLGVVTHDVGDARLEA